MVGNFVGLPLCTVPSVIVHCNQNEAGHQTTKAPSMPCWGAAGHWKRRTDKISRQVKIIDASRQNKKSRYFLFFLMNKTLLWVDLSFFNQSYSGGITTTKKPTGYWRYYHSRCRPSLSCGLPGVHTMSDELILQISWNIFLASKWIIMITSGQNISQYTTAKLSVHVWNHDLNWWQNKIDTQKHFHKTTITSSWTLSKTIFPSQ